MKMSDLDVLLDRDEFVKNDVLKEALYQAREWIYQLHTLIHDDLGVDVERGVYVIGNQERDILSQERLELYRESGNGENIVLETDDGEHLCDVFLTKERWSEICAAAEHEGVDPLDWFKQTFIRFALNVLEEEE